jgi:D-alanyl-D-alanine carboxypeptidase (penicillin-binding protein 5/6)
VPKGSSGRVVANTELPEVVSAPLKSGEKVGEISFLLDGKTIGGVEICAKEDAERVSFKQIFLHILKKCCLL